MPKLERAIRRRKRVPVGDLSERIWVEDRELQVPAFGAADSDFAFTPHPSATRVWANIETLSGVTYFDEVAGLDRALSHRIIIRFLKGISAETWLRLADGTRLDILNVANLDERDEFLTLDCAASGRDTRKASGL